LNLCIVGRGSKIATPISVDQTGESALLEMAMEGARLIASRAYMKYILEGLHLARE
jgi:hypothetical protein